MAQAYPCWPKEDNIMNGTISKMGQSHYGTISWDNHPTMGLPQQWHWSTIMTSPQMGQHVHQPIMSTAMAITHTTVRQGWDHSSRSNDREKQKSGTFLPPPQRRRFIPIINHEKIIKKSALVQIPPANTVFRENIIHISTDQGRAKPWPMEKIYSQRTMFKSSKEINIKNNHQVDKNACAPKNQHAYLTALGTKRASLAMLFVCGATLTLT